MKATPRSPPIIKSQHISDNLAKFCLMMAYLSEWGLSRVQRTTPALDNPQADRYCPNSRMTLSIKYRKKRGILWN